MTPDRIPKEQVNLKPVDKEYVSTTEMIADQENQSGGFIYFDSELYWEYRGTTAGTIADYREIVSGQRGAGAGLSIDGNGDIQLGDNDTILFTPKSVSLNDGSLTHKGNFYLNLDNSSFEISSFDSFNESYFQYFSSVGNVDSQIQSNTALNSSFQVLRADTDNYTSFIQNTNNNSTDAGISLNVSEKGSGNNRSVNQSISVRNDSSLYFLKIVSENTFDFYQLEMGQTFGGSYSAVFTDSINDKGLQYAANYFTNGSADDRWIPDWGAVKSYVDNNTVGAGAGLSIDGNGDIQLGDDDSVFFVPRTNTSSFDADLYINGRIGYYYADTDYAVDYLVGSGLIYTAVTGPNGAIYKTEEIFDTPDSADYNVQTVSTGDALANSTFYRQFSSPTSSRFEIMASRGLSLKQGFEFGLDNGTWGSKFTDTATLKGLVYAANYFTNGSADDRWIPDWGAVKGYGNDRYVRYDINNQGLGSTNRQNARTNILAVSTDTADTITGLKTIRRAGPNDGSAIATTLGWEIGSDDLYKLTLDNTQNETFTDGEVNWFLRHRNAYTDGVNTKGVTQSMIGFFKAGITVIGGRHPSSTIANDVRTWINSNYASELPYPLSLYAYRDIMVEGRGYFGKNNFTDTLFLGSDDKLYSSGTVYAAKGLRTADADNPTTVFDGSVVFIGAVASGSGGAHTHKMRIRHNNTLFDVLMEEVT